MEARIETDRLFLRELEIADSGPLSLVLSDPESMRYYPVPFSPEKVDRWIAWNIENYRTFGFGLWAVVLKDSGEMIGDCGITMQDIEGSRIPELGYHIRKTYCGKGYASEAARACMAYAFSVLGLESIVSYMKADNLPSRRVAEKNGMSFVRNFRKEISGVRVDEALYRISKQEFLKKKSAAESA